jgi:YidC/Oxa1 family membrane protein insertase
MIIAHWFILIIYQPFLNLLVSIYWVLLQIPHFPHPDMGVAVIIFTVAFRIILLPISMASSRSEKDRRAIEAKVAELNESLAHDPVAQKRETKQVFKDNPWTLVAAYFDLLLQVSIAFMLWRIFAKGLEGADLHYLYSFAPHPATPYNLEFWGLYDLSKPNMTLNLIQSLMIFLVEVIHLWTSPYPITRQDIIRLLIFLPLVSFLIFMFLPAGKKLFIITTLLFSIGLNLIRQLHYLMNKHLIKPPTVATPLIANQAQPTSITPTNN